MSFFDTAAKQLTQSSNDLGPGQYKSHSDFDTAARNYAPFGSLVGKRAHSKGNELGPGQYNVGGELIKPCISRYQNRNIIIIKINDEGGYQFKSGGSRFPKTQQENSIGPGSYEIHPQRKTKSNSFSKSSAKQTQQKMRFINRQYHQQRQPTLLSDSPMQQPLEQEQSFREPKSILNWSLNKQERFPKQRQNYQSNQTQKRQAMSQIQLAKKKKIKPSAVFASKSIKSHIETQIYKTNNPFKAELRKLIDYKDDEPGPGSYDPGQKIEKTTQKNFQFFGSTVDRFRSLEDTSIGPGSYSLDEKKEQREKKQYYLTHEKRDSYIPKQENPGPGSYHCQSLKNVSHITKQNVKDKPFGSQQPRFKSQGNEDGQSSNQNFELTAYFKQKQQRKDQQLRLRKEMLQKHQNSCFASGSRRFQMIESGPDVGAYDISQNDITSKLQRYKKLVKQLEECQLHKAPFMSSSNRFEDDKPLQQTHKDCWCLVKSVEKQIIQHQSSSFLSNGQRKLFQQKPQAPPVGSYSRADPPWIRDSFNTRFKKRGVRERKQEPRVGLGVRREQVVRIDG